MVLILCWHVSMFIIISLVLPLNAHATVSDRLVVIRPFAETSCVPEVNWVAENRLIKRDFPSMNEVIQFAKNAATQLSSPPRIYSTSGNSISLWPNQPGSIEVTYETRGIELPGEDDLSGTVPMRLTTLVEAGIDPRSFNVTFQSTWTESNIAQSHAWKFHVSAEHQATFIGEEGNDLPPLPM